MTNWTTWVRMPNGQIVQVYTQAPTPGEAKLIFEGQYGGPNILHLPTPA